MKTTRIVIADDHELAREGLRTMLERSGRFAVVGEAATAEEALTLCAQVTPDLALLDIRYGPKGSHAGIDGLEAARRLADTMPAIASVILTMHDSAEYLRAAIAAGARGFIAKDATREALLGALDQVSAGSTAFPADLMRQAVSEPRPQPEFAAIARLTPRERDVLDALSDGGTNKEIALNLGISPGTVKTHVERLISKLGVRDRTQAAVVAVQYRAGQT